MGDRAARDGNDFRRGGRTHLRVGALLACAGLLLACSKSPPSSRPKRGPGIGPVVENAEPAEHPKVSDPGLPLPQMAADEAPIAEQVQAQDKPTEAEKPQRDYPNELLQRLGNPANCLSPRPSDGNLRPIQISIAAQLMPSGALARTELKAAELNGTERACLSQRVGSLRLAGPIEGAPLGVQASLTLQPSAAKPNEAAAAKPEMKDMAAEPGQAPEPSTFLEPSPEAKEVPAAPPVQITGEGTTP